MSDLITVGSQQFRVLFPGLLRPLSEVERAELLADIAQRGCVDVPVSVDDSRPVMGLIDGEHRVRLAAHLGLDGVPVRQISGLSEEAKRKRALALNTRRRHLSQEEMSALRQQRVERLLAGRAEGKSTRQLAAEEKVSQPQVVRDLQASGDTGVSPERVAGRDGKTYPASPAAAAPAAESVIDTLADLRCPVGVRLTPLTLGPFTMARPRILDWCRDIDAAAVSLRDLARRPGGEFLPGYLVERLEAIRLEVERAAPHAACCPQCRAAEADCQTCHGAGFVSRRLWELASEARRREVLAV